MRRQQRRSFFLFSPSSFLCCDRCRSSDDVRYKERREASRDAERCFFCIGIGGSTSSTAAAAAAPARGGGRCCAQQGRRGYPAIGMCLLKENRQCRGSGGDDSGRSRWRSFLQIMLHERRRHRGYCSRRRRTPAAIAAACAAVGSGGGCAAGGGGGAACCRQGCSSGRDGRRGRRHLLLLRRRSDCSRR